MEVTSLNPKTVKIDILGIAIDNITMEEAISYVDSLREQNVGGYVVTPNPEIIFHSQEDPELAKLINKARLVVPDGIGVIKAAKTLERPLRGRVPGVELGEAILPSAAARGDRLYIYGAKPGVAEEAGRRLAAKYPGLIICGTSDGYGKDDDALCEKIDAAKPDLMFICLGTPAQERWMAAHTARFPRCLMFGLGGSVDIYSGTVQRAPKFWRTLNLEWFYRLACQPKRIGRFLKSTPPFLCAVRRQHRAEKKAARQK